MRTALILIGACMLLTGCAKYYDSLVNPETKDGVNCVASGWGWLGTPIAAHQSNQCLEQYTSAGYNPASFMGGSYFTFQNLATKKAAHL
jgi:hypothetical protein